MSAQFHIDPEAVRSAGGNVSGLLVQTITLALDLERMNIAPASYAQIGSEVATADGLLKGQQVSALQALLTVLQDVNGLVKQAADTAQSDDESIAASLGGTGTGTGPDSRPSGGDGLLSALWSSPSAGHLAGQAMAAGTHPVDATTSQSVSTVLGYMNNVGMGDLTTRPVPAQHAADPAAFANWLDTDPDNQTHVGVIGIYAGNTATLTDVPGGVHPGDVVYASRWQLADGPAFQPHDEHAIGVVGTDGQLYNNGQINTDDWHDVTDLRVYRPLSNSL